MSNAAAAAEAPPPAKGKKKLIIIIAAAVLLLGGGGTAAMLLMKKKPVDEDGEEAAQVEKADAKSAKAAAPRHDPKKPPVFAPLDPFTVNLADRETERYAQVALTLELDDAKTADVIKNFMPAIRNNILMVLAHKTSTQILAAEGKTQLAGEIQRATVRALGIEVSEPVAEGEDDEGKTKKKRKKKAEAALPVVAVHFSNFIVQ